MQIASSISVVMGNRKTKVILCRSANLVNLTSIPREPQPVLKKLADKDPMTLKLSLLNIMSLAGKIFLITDFIIEHILDFMFLTETWLNQNNSASVLIESTPPNFSVMSEARAQKRGGRGVAILFNDSFQCKQLAWKFCFF